MLLQRLNPANMLQKTTRCHHRNEKNMTLVGLEPTISGSVDRCLIHWATGPTAVKEGGLYRKNPTKRQAGANILTLKIRTYENDGACED